MQKFISAAPIYYILTILISLTFLNGCSNKGSNLGVKVYSSNEKFEQLIASVPELTERIESSTNQLLIRHKIPLEVYVEDTDVYTYDKSDYIKAKAIDVNFYVKPLERQVLFPSGKYTLQESLGGVYFVAAIKEFLAELQSIQGDELLTLNGLFEGGADKWGSKKASIGYYNGEYGIINEKNVKLNGKKQNVILRKGDLIDNLTLAFLRAYSVYDEFMFIAKEINITRRNYRKINFVANEYDKSGRRYRFGKITISVEPNENFDT
jgi:hypothetical protein